MSGDNNPTNNSPPSQQQSEGLSQAADAAAQPATSPIAANVRNSSNSPPRIPAPSTPPRPPPSPVAVIPETPTLSQVPGRVAVDLGDEEGANRDLQHSMVTMQRVHQRMQQEFRVELYLSEERAPDSF